MKNSLSLKNIFLALFLLVCFLGCAKKEIKNLDSKGKNIICFGDSITYGYGVSREENYPSALEKLLNFKVINAGIDGDTSIEGLKRIKSDVLDRNPRLVIIEFSGNDFLRKIPKEVTLENISRMTDKIQEKGGMVAIVDISAGMFLREYRGALKKIAVQKGVIFVSGVLNGIITNPSLKSDFLHPNAKGYQLIAERIYRRIIPYLNQNSLDKQEK